MSIENIDEEFRAALRHTVRSLKGKETQRKIAARIGISPSYLNNLLKGNRYGDEIARRTIAERLGYPSYEEFLSLGREALSGENPPVREVKKARLPIPPPTVRVPAAQGEVERLLGMAMTVLKSGGKFATALRENIEAFHLAVTGEGPAKDEDPIQANSD